MVDHSPIRMHSSARKVGVIQNSDPAFAQAPSIDLSKFINHSANPSFVIKKKNRLQSARIRKKDEELIEFPSAQLSSGPDYPKEKIKRRKKSYEQLRKRFSVLKINEFMIKKED